ncbi:reverse transcriptase domain-containing protein [Tanacetum coccineum]
MHTRSFNSELVEPLPEPEQTVNRRLRRRNRRVPFEQRNEPPAQPKVVYALILDINYFHHFLDILENYNPMDDEPMWAADRVVTPTPSSAITIPETTNEFAIKGTSNSDTDKIMARMDAMTMKMDAQYKELQSRSKQPNPDHNDDDTPMSHEEEAKFIGRNDYNRDDYQSNSDDKLDLQKQLSDFIKAQHSTNSFINNTFMDLKTKHKTTAKNHQASIQNLEAKFDKIADKQSGRPSGSLPSNTQPNPKGSSSKPYQPPQAQNEQVNAIFTWSGKSYDSPINPNDQPNKSKTPVNFDNDDEDEESTPQPKLKDPKPIKETPTPKPYKPKTQYPQRLRKEKMEARYGKFLDMIRAVRINVPLIDVIAGMPNYDKFLKELVSNKHKLEQISAAFLSAKNSTLIQNKVPPKLRDPEGFLIPCNFNKAFSCVVLADLGASINLKPYSLYAKLSLKTLKPTKMSVRLADRSFQYPVGIARNMLVEVGKFTFLVDFVILEMKEDIGTERMTYHMDSAMKHFYSNDDTCFSIDVIDEILEEDFNALLDEEPPTDLELKPLPDNLEYEFLEEPSFLPEVVKKEIVKLLDTGIIYPIADSPWVSPIHCVLNKGGITVVTNEKDELVPTRNITCWRVCIDYRKLNEATAKDHFPLPFMDQMLERLIGNKYFYFLNGFSGYFQIIIDPMDQEKTTFTCPFGTYAYRRMPFGLCNAPATFQRRMLAIFHDMIEEPIEVFMDDFSVFGNSFDHCLKNLDKMLQRCKDENLILNWEKCHFMVKEGIMLGHKVSGAGLEVDKAKIDVISKLPPLLMSKALEVS